MCFPPFFKAVVMYVCVSDFLFPIDWVIWGSKNPYILCFPLSKHNPKRYLNFNKLVLIYLINQKYTYFNIWTYIIHNCRIVMLIFWAPAARSNKSDMWTYNGRLLCLPKTLASHGTYKTVVSKVVATSTNVATGSSMENIFLFRRGSFVSGSCYSSINKQILKLVRM